MYEAKKGREGSARKFEEHVDLALMATSLDESIHHVHHPRCAFSTWGTLATRFVLVELRDVLLANNDEAKMGRTDVSEAGNGGYDVSAFVHDNDSTGPQTRLRILERVIIHPVPKSIKNKNVEQFRLLTKLPHIWAEVTLEPNSLQE